MQCLQLLSQVQQEKASNENTKKIILSIITLTKFGSEIKTLFLLNLVGLVGIPGIEPGSLAALVFELVDDTYV